VVFPQEVRMNVGEPIDLNARFGKTRDFSAPTALLEKTVRDLAARR